MIANAEAPVLEIIRIFDAPPDRVFAAWLEREEWQAWIGPEGINCEVLLLEPQVGGRYRLIMHLPDGSDIPVVGIFKAIEPTARLAFTWTMEGEARDTLVTLEFRNLGGKTELKLRHEGLLGAADRQGHGEGWNSAFNKLAAYLKAQASS